MDISERIRLYVNACPPAISGQRGHDSTFQVAAALINGFALSHAEAMRWMQVYNQTCQPPWPEGDLDHKVKSAMTKLHDKPRGHLIGTVQPQESRIEHTLKHFTAGTLDSVKRLALARGIGREGIQWAVDRGVLVFGSWNGHDCWAVKDRSGKVLELRKMDGLLFPAHGGLSERKSHSVKGSSKGWPIGILEAKNYPCIALVEGGPDFLAAHYEIIWEQAPSHTRQREIHCAPVAMLSASPDISPEALPHFKGKAVRIFPHAESAGVLGAQKWQHQIIASGVRRCEIFDMTRVRRLTDGICKDLNDFLNIKGPTPHPSMERIMPCE